MGYTLQLDGDTFAATENNGLGRELGKIVCVGRNYAAHAAELNNPIPTEPILFMKPATAAAEIGSYFSIPSGRGSCHIETEIAVLIGSELCRASESQALDAVAGIGIGLDLTLRDLQATLKDKGLPWEKAKAFDGSCPLTGFMSPAADEDYAKLGLVLKRNNVIQQDGNSGQMLTPIISLLSYISEHFTLMPGDVVLTGTPAGVGPLDPGDHLELELKLAQSTLRVSTEVVAKAL